jgi:hypothetical protein
VPDCASNLFMRAGQPCITFLYAPAVSCGSTLQQLQWERLSFQSCFLHVAYVVGHSVKIAACMPLSLPPLRPLPVSLLSGFQMCLLVSRDAGPTCSIFHPPLLQAGSTASDVACFDRNLCNPCWLQGDPAVEAVVRGVMAANEPPIRPERVLGLANSSEIDAWMLAHPETSLAAVIFSPPEAPAAAAGPGSTAGGSTSSLPASAGSMNGNVTAAGWGGNGSAVAASMPAAGVAALPGAVGSDGYGAAAGGPAGVAAVGLGGSVQLGSSAVQRLGFTVQTNSSVQWFKGSYQHPNTYIQARASTCAQLHAGALAMAA